MAGIKQLWQELSDTKKNRLVDIMVAQKSDSSSIKREVSFKWWLYGQIDFSQTKEGFDYWCNFINNHIDKVERKNLRNRIEYEIETRYAYTEADKLYLKLIDAQKALDSARRIFKNKLL